MLAAQVCREDDIVRVSTARNLTLVSWWNAPKVEHVDWLRQALLRTNQQFPSGIALINVIYGGIPKFTNDVREGISSLMRETNLLSVGSAHVILAPGLAGAATRTFLSTMFLMARTKYPNRVFGAVAPAAQWLVPLINPPAGDAWTAEEVVSLCASEARRAS